jgi:rSAM/selenodomain-associated transferase 1
MRARVCAVAVMAKAPRVGRSKTRLCPPLTPATASRLSAAFIQDITANLALAARDAPLVPYVAFAPAGTEALFAGLLAPGASLVLADGAIPAPPGVAGLGLALLHAMRALFAEGFGGVCLLNSDSPDLPTAVLRDAARRLMAPEGEAVLGPAEDGGYYLLGLRAPHAGMFADIAWSTGEVAAMTRARAAALGLRLDELPPWYDVDDAASLRRLLAGGGEGGPVPDLKPSGAPATRAVLARLSPAERLRA